MLYCQITNRQILLRKAEEILSCHSFVNDCYISNYPTKTDLAILITLSDKGISVFREQGRKNLINILKQWLDKSLVLTTTSHSWFFTDKLIRNNQSEFDSTTFIKICTQKQIDPVWYSRKQQDNLQILQGKVPLDLIYFRGHFEKFPLVPGVIELQWVVDQIMLYFSKDIQIIRIDNLKFQKFLRPNDELELILKWEETKSRMAFQLKTDNEMCGSGLVILQHV